MGGKGSGRKKLTDEEIIGELEIDELDIKHLLMDLIERVARYVRSWTISSKSSFHLVSKPSFNQSLVFQNSFW